MTPDGRPAPVLGPFCLMEPAGSGAMAQVWRAEHLRLGVPVAIKVLTRAESPDVPALFAHEVRAVARLNHPAVIRLHDHGMVPEDVALATGLPAGAPYLVMEWLPDGSLRQRAAALRWRELRTTLLVLLDALGHAHARGVIHRDLKPDNVLIAERGPVLSDFGVAASIEGESQGPRLLVGTPNYMAPEQIRGDWRTLGPWTDLYAVGCLSWHLASGRAPFAGRGRQAVLRAHVREAPPAFNPCVAVPLGFEAWLRRLLAKRPQDRYRFAAEAARALLALGRPDSGTISTAPPAVAPPEITVITPPLYVTEQAAPAAPGEVAPPTVPSSWRRPSAPQPPPPLPGVGRALVSLREVDLFGRDAERDTLWGALQGVSARGRPLVVILEGPGGYGKSRLATWLARRAQELGICETLFASHSDSSAVANGLGPMICRYFRCTGQAAEDRLDRIATAIGATVEDGDLVRALAALSEAGQFTGAGGRLVLGSERERHATLRRGLARIAGPRPLILNLDDLQWGADAIRFVLSLLDDPAAPPVLVVGTVRDDASPDASVGAGAMASLVARPDVKVLDVGPLSEVELGRLCRAFLPLSHDVVDRIVRRAEGNPLFAEELIRHWIRTDALENTSSGFRLRSRALTGTPDAIRNIWETRLGEALRPVPAGGRDACEIAAALGSEVRFAEWQAACDLAEVTLWPVMLERLQDARLMIRDPGGAAWRFAHPMLRESLRAAAQEAGRWAHWNAHCGTLLELIPDADPERLANHLVAAGRWQDALEPLEAAAKAHFERADLLAARRVVLLRARALRALRVPRDAAAWVETRLAWAEQAVAQVETRAARRRAGRALVSARRLDDDRLIAKALVVLGRVHRHAQAGGEGLVCLDEAVQRADRLDDAHLACAARLERTWCLAQIGRLAEAELAARVVLTGKARPDLTQRAEARYAVAAIARHRGRIHQAELFGEAAYSGYREAGARFGMATAAGLLGDVARSRGDLETAEHRYQEGLSLIDAVGGRGREALLCSLGLVYLAGDDTHRARSVFEEGLEHATRAGDALAEAVGEFLVLACDARLGRWRACEARRHVMRGLRTSGVTGVPDIAGVARDLALRAEAAIRYPVADEAWSLAEARYRALERPDDAAGVRAQRAEASARRVFQGRL